MFTASKISRSKGKRENKSHIMIMLPRYQFKLSIRGGKKVRIDTTRLVTVLHFIIKM